MGSPSRLNWIRPHQEKAKAASPSLLASTGDLDILPGRLLIFYYSTQSPDRLLFLTLFQVSPPFFVLDSFLLVSKWGSLVGRRVTC
jgi:hypothetical protein